MVTEPIATPRKTLNTALFFRGTFRTTIIPSTPEKTLTLVGTIQQKTRQDSELCIQALMTLAPPHVGINYSSFRTDSQAPLPKRHRINRSIETVATLLSSINNLEETNNFKLVEWKRISIVHGIFAAI